MFVKYSCGCIGLEVKGLRPILLHACDDTTDSQYVGFTEVGEERDADLKSKEKTPLTDKEAGRLVKRLGCLVYDGHELRELKRILRTP